MTTEPSLSPAQLGAESLRTVGELVCLYAELEGTIRRFIAVLIRLEASHLTEAFLAGHRFRPPLRVLSILVRSRYAGDPLKLRKYSRWRNRVNKLMGRRNTMVHGAWVDEHGALRYRTFARALDAHAHEVCGSVMAKQLASDTHFLRLDTATIKRWIVGSYLPAE